MSMATMKAEDFDEILSNAHLEMEGTGFGAEMIVSVMAKTKLLSASMRNIYFVSNKEFFKKMASMDEIVDLIDLNTRVSEVEAGRMGSLVGMDVFVNENAAINSFAIVVRDLNGNLICTTMRVVDMKE